MSCSSKTSPACSVDSPCSRARAIRSSSRREPVCERAARSAPPRPRAGAGRRRGAGELGVAVGQRLDHGLVHGAEERRLEAEARAVQDGAPDDPAQHVAAALVGGRDAVGRDRAHAAAVVAEHAERAHGIAAVGVAPAREALQGLDHVRRLVGLEEAAGVLQEHGDALDAAARVDVLRRKRREGAVVAAIELHEDEIPELEEAIAVAARLAVGPAAAVLRAAVVVELRARAARPGRPGLPEVVLAERDDAARRGCPARARDRARRRRARAGRRPRRRSPRCARGRAPSARRELVGHLDRARLEVVAEREVAHHLEERQVAVGRADHVDVDRAEAALDRRQTRRRAASPGRGSTA